MFSTQPCKYSAFHWEQTVPCKGEVFQTSVRSQLRSHTGTWTYKDPPGRILFIPSFTVAPPTLLIMLAFFVLKTVTKLALPLDIWYQLRIVWKVDSLCIKNIAWLEVRPCDNNGEAFCLSTRNTHMGAVRYKFLQNNFFSTIRRAFRHEYFS